MYHLDESECNIECNTEPFDSTVWSVVRMASNCEDLGQRIQAALDGRDQEEIEIIFENVTHQMSFYSATYLVLPHMVKLLEEVLEEGDTDYAFYLIFNLGICLATDTPGNRFEEIDSPVLKDYNAAARKLAGLTKRYINTYHEEIQEMDEEQRNMLLTSVIAIFGERELASLMVNFSWDMEEIGMACGADCEYYEDCFSPIDSEDDTIISVEYESGSWDGQSFEDPFLWASAMAEMFGAEQELEVLRIVYGTFTCPECGETKKVIEFMEAYMNE